MEKQRTLVCLVSAQTLPNFLFIKEMYIPGDRILLITSKGGMEQHATHLEEALGWANATIHRHTFSEKGLEDNFQAMSKELSTILIEGVHYVVNLTGGTKLMSLALYKQMERMAERELYYMPYPRMLFCQLEGEDVEVTTHLSVADYFALYGIDFKSSHSGCTASKETAKHFFLYFTTCPKSEAFFSAMDLLRVLRDKKQVILADHDGVMPVVKFFQYQTHEEGKLSRKEVEYLTGGWFEEWTYYTLKEHWGVADDCISINAHISIQNRQNELDVAMVLNNALYIVECKSGIDGRRMLSEILDKANSIKALTRSLSAESVLYALVEDNDDWRKTAQAVGIRYVDKTSLLDENKRYSFVK